MYVSDGPGGSGINKVVTMRRILLRSTISFMTLAAVPCLLHAQARGGAGGGAHAGGGMAGAPHASFAAPVHSSAPTGGHVSSGSHTTVPAPHFAPGARLVRTPSGRTVLRIPAPRPAANSRPNNNRRLLSQDVPGLGFDYTHLAAVGGSRGRGRGRVGDRDHDRRRNFVAYFPFFGGGYYEPLFPEEYDDTGTAADSGETEGVEPDYYPERPPRPEEYAQNYPPAPPAPVEAAAPAKPADEYVFVRRDGTLFFAVAYAWENGTLRYVTGEGLRRSVEDSALDLDATKQFNDQRGLNFRLPAWNGG
jgi:hypothetical protein